MARESLFDVRNARSFDVSSRGCPTSSFVTTGERLFEVTDATLTQLACTPPPSGAPPPPPSTQPSAAAQATPAIAALIVALATLSL